MNAKFKLIIPDTTRILFITLFTYTAVSKLKENHRFELVLDQFPFLSSISSFIALAIPLVELLVVLLLAIPKFRKIGLWAAVALLLVFTVYIICMFIYLPYLPCSCGGVLQSLSWKQHVILNLLFIALGATSLVLMSDPTVTFFKNHTKYFLRKKQEHC